MASARPWPPPIADSGTAAALLAPGFRDLDHERLCLLHLDEGLRLLGVTRAPPGVAHEVAVPVRALIGEALRRDARKLILAHNHPAGNPQPSRADRDVTRQLAGVATSLGMTVLDHIIFAGADWISFRAMGLL